MLTLKDHLEGNRDFGHIGHCNFILENLLQDGNWHQLHYAKKYCVSKKYGMGHVFDSLIFILLLSGIVEEDDGRIRSKYCVAKPHASSPMPARNYWPLINGVLRALKRERLVTTIFSSLQEVELDGRVNLELICSSIPVPYHPIVNFLRELELLGAGYISAILWVNDAHAAKLIELVSGFIEEEAGDQGATEGELKASLKAKEAAGERAEEYVLAVERSRLIGHKNIAWVRRISIENVSAGYDIRSYESLQSIICDRFIEVKGFSQGCDFYWSANEIEIAKKAGDKYFLCLVDLAKIDDEGYRPQYIRDPYAKFAAGGLPACPDSAWRIDAASWHFSLTEN